MIDRYRTTARFKDAYRLEMDIASNLPFVLTRFLRIINRPTNSYEPFFTYPLEKWLDKRHSNLHDDDTIISRYWRKEWDKYRRGLRPFRAFERGEEGEEEENAKSLEGIGEKNCLGNRSDMCIRGAQVGRSIRLSIIVPVVCKLAPIRCHPFHPCFSLRIFFRSPKSLSVSKKKKRKTRLLIFRVILNIGNF